MIGLLYNFFLSYGFVFELLISFGLFVWTFPRRKYFVLRLLGVVAGLFALSFVWVYIAGKVSSPFVPMGRYISSFTAVVLGVSFCFKKPLIVALFCGVGAYATQHGAYKIGEMLRFAVRGFVPEVVEIVIYVATLAVVFTVVYFLFARNMRGGDKEYIDNKQVVFLCVALLLFTTTFQYSTELEMQIYLIYALYDTLCCVFTLTITRGLFKSGKLRHEYKVMEHLSHLEKKQYEMSKETVELINIKYHDLKHLIASFGDRVSEDEKYELERAITMYDMTVKTGNEVLDVVFTEKSLACDQKRIKLEKIADGSLLDFMSASDIYSLFGNALDNAIEAVSKIDDPEKRIINLMLRETHGMALIHIENYYAGDILFKDGLPVTTKGNNLYHGFGTKSMRNIAEKYGGNIDISTDDDVFHLNIVIPLRRYNVHKTA